MSIIETSTKVRAAFSLLSFLDESMKYRQHYPQLQDNNSPDGARTIAERLLPGFSAESIKERY